MEQELFDVLDMSDATYFPETLVSTCICPWPLFPLSRNDLCLSRNDLSLSLSQNGFTQDNLSLSRETTLSNYTSFLPSFFLFAFLSLSKDLIYITPLSRKTFLSIEMTSLFPSKRPLPFFLTKPPLPLSFLSFYRSSNLHGYLMNFGMNRIPPPSL